MFENYSIDRIRKSIPVTDCIVRGAVMLSFLLVLIPVEVRADTNVTSQNITSQNVTSSVKTSTSSVTTAADKSADTSGSAAVTSEDKSGQKDSGYISPDVLTKNTTGEPFSIEGNGQIVDDAFNDDTKEFITVQTKNNQTFFVVIDRANAINNVYMLSQIDEDDLSQFLDEDDEADMVDISDLNDISQQMDETKEKSSGNGIMLYVVLILAVGGILAAYYYIRIYKPRQEENEAESENLENEGYEEDEDYEDEEEGNYESGYEEESDYGTGDEEEYFNAEDENNDEYEGDVDDENADLS